MSTSTQQDLVRLRETIASHLSPEELQTICHTLGISYHDLPGSTHTVKAMELVEYCRRDVRLQDLVAALKQMRPRVAWEPSEGGTVPGTGPTLTEKQQKELDRLSQLKKDQEDHLYVLQRQKAMYGIATPPHIVLGMRDAEQEIARIEKRIARLLQQVRLPVPADTRGAAPFDFGEELGPVRNRYALVVGINRYNDPNFSPLRSCQNDAQEMEQTLKQAGYKVMLMHDGLEQDCPLYPTQNNVRAYLHQLARFGKRDDMVLFFFAGHGYRTSEGEPLLILRDTLSMNLKQSALTLTEVRETLLPVNKEDARARRNVLILDACQLGAPDTRFVYSPEFIKNVHERAWGFALLAASTSEQVAREAGDHGIFTSFVLKGLRGEARVGEQADENFVSVQSLSNYVLDQLTNWSFEQVAAGTAAFQEPTTRTEGMGDMMVADYRPQP